jgi:hypothetical protein
VNQPTITEREQRKAKREERRAKQRIENIGRAKKMHVARLAGQIPLTQFPARQSSLDQSILRIGCSGWFYWHLKDSFYRGLPSSEWFAHYASKFNSVELNAPFYAWPTVSTVRTWVKQAGRRKFAYSVKVSELITHIKRFRGTKTLIRDFGLIADILGPRMG